MNYKVLVFLLCAAVLLGAALVMRPTQEKKSITIEGVQLSIEVADTDAERTRGLSGRASLAEGTGMWFVFNKPDYEGIWMKDMRFPIDILWFDESLKLVHIEESVLPSTYPTVFRPAVPARYVLELPAGSAQLYGFAIGTVAVQ